VKRGRGKSVTIGDFSERGRWSRARSDPRRLALTCADVLVLSVRRSLANGVPAGKVANSDTMACGTGMSIHARLRDDHYRAGRRLQEARISVPTALRQQQSL